MQPLHVLSGHGDTVTCVAVNLDADIVVTGSADGTCIIHTLSRGQYVRTIDIRDRLFYAPKSSARDTLNRGCRPESSTFMPLHRFSRAQTPSHGENSTESLCITWVGISHSKYTIAVYVAENFSITNYTVNGKYLCSTADNSSDDEDASLNEVLHALVISHDGSTLVTGGTERVIVVYDMNTLRALQRLDGCCPERDAVAFTATITSIALTNTEGHCLVGLSNGEMRILVLDGEYLRSALQKRLTSLGF